jgi:hypothetical protein
MYYEEIRLMRIPRGNEWDYFDAYVSSILGLDKWIAGFDDGLQAIPWEAGGQVPRPGQRVRVFWVKEAVKPEKKEMREEKLKKVTQVILSRPKPADAHPIRAGGKSVPLQQMQFREQKPLSLKSERKPRFTEEDLKQRSERFNQAKADLEAPMSTEEFKKMRWVKLARKKGIPYFEEPATLQPTPTLSIECEPTKTISTSPDKFFDKKLSEDRAWLGKEWKEEYTWDLVSREVALVWNDVRSYEKSVSRKVQMVWKKGLEKGNAAILEERVGEEVRRFILRCQGGNACLL